MPDDIHLETMIGDCFCEPGVKNKSRSKGLDIAYTWRDGGTFKTPQNNPSRAPELLDTRDWKIDVKLPIWNKEDFKFLVGYKFISTQLDFEQLGDTNTEALGLINQEKLKSHSLNATLVKPINATQYILLRASYSANGNYNNGVLWNSDYAVQRYYTGYVVKPNDDLEWGGGVYFSKNFRNSILLPFFIYNRNFSSKWGIESVLPAYVLGRYNWGRKQLLLFGAEYNGQSFRLRSEDNNLESLDYAYNQAAVILSLKLERQIVPWVWMNVKCGYYINFSSSFEARNVQSPSFDITPPDGPFINFSLFLSPPSKD